MDLPDVLVYRDFCATEINSLKHERYLGEWEKFTFKTLDKLLAVADSEKTLS